MGILFECDLCQFSTVNEKDTIHGNARDHYTFLCIRRAVMDTFRIRETSTVLGDSGRHRRHYFESVKVLSIKIPVPNIGANNVMYIIGMGCAIQTLDASRRKGKCQDYLQWDSMRRTPTWYNNAWEAGVGYS